MDSGIVNKAIVFCNDQVKPLVQENLERDQWIMKDTVEKQLFEIEGQAYIWTVT